MKSLGHKEGTFRGHKEGTFRGAWRSEMEDKKGKGKCQIQLSRASTQTHIVSMCVASLLCPGLV